MNDKSGATEAEQTKLTWEKPRLLMLKPSQTGAGTTNGTEGFHVNNDTSMLCCCATTANVGNS